MGSGWKNFEVRAGDSLRCHEQTVKDDSAEDLESKEENCR